MQTVHLHIDQKSKLPELHAKQMDVGRKFKTVITDGSEGYQIPEGVQLSVWYSGTSGEGHYSMIGANSAFAVEGDTVTVELITQMLTNKGGGTLCLSMNAADGSQIGLWDIPYIVEALPGAGSTAAQQYYNAFSETVAGALEAAERAENAVETMTPDQTLSLSGRAADAAAVGTALDGKASAGYGLGGSDKEITSLSVLDATKANGWYSFYYNGDTNVNINGNLAGGILVVQSRNDVRQFFFKESGNVFLVRRYDNDTSTWGEWGYINPPMEASVEYRTTERWSGKPVYTKLIDYGDVGTGYSSFYTSCGTRVIRAAVTHGASAVPFDGVSAINNQYTVAVGINNTHLHFYAGTGVETANLSAQFWYIKD